MSGLSRKWRCRSCGYIYDEALGLPEEGIAPGTPFETIPDDVFYCPDCGTEKQDFELMDY
jgi:rubredoxin